MKIDDKALFCSASSAGSKYMYRAQLDDHKHQQKTDAQSRKRKQMYDEIDAVIDKKTCIEKEVAELQNGIEDFATRAEENRNKNEKKTFLRSWSKSRGGIKNRVTERKKQHDPHPCNGTKFR